MRLLPAQSEARMLSQVPALPADLRDPLRM
jgi:hypothetical protein